MKIFQKMFCFHNWEIKGAQRYRDGDFKTCHTEVLYVCKICKKIKVKEVNGHWDVESLGGESEK